MSGRAVSHVGAREWNAEVYHRVCDPQFEWGTEVLGRLPLRGDETVLDAGCGSGRVTALLVDRLPRGRVVGVDASQSMLDKARETLGDRVELRLGDLTELELGEPVDVVFSNAVFHWVDDHELLFRRLHDALHPGGRLVAQCGGEGNVASLARAIAEAGGEPRFAGHLGGTDAMPHFSSADDAERRLRSAGFEGVECRLETKHVTPEHPLEFIAAATLGPHLARLPDSLTDEFTHAVAERLRSPVTLDYVRLNINARRVLRSASGRGGVAGEPDK